jgi:hypothetical protein
MVCSTVNHPHHPFINGGRSTTSQISNQLYLNHLSICMNPIFWWLEKSAGQISFWITSQWPFDSNADPASQSIPRDPRGKICNMCLYPVTLPYFPLQLVDICAVLFRQPSLMRLSLSVR